MPASPGIAKAHILAAGRVIGMARPQKVGNGLIIAAFYILVLKIEAQGGACGSALVNPGEEAHLVRLPPGGGKGGRAPALFKPIRHMRQIDGRAGPQALYGTAHGRAVAFAK